MSRRLPFDAPVADAATLRAALAGLPAAMLSQRAGLAVAREVRRLAGGRPVLIAAGSGLTGLVAAGAGRMLADWGLDVVVVRFGSPFEDVAAHCSAEPRAILVDGLGDDDGRLDASVAAWFAERRAGAERVIAVHLPSGLDPDAREGRASLAADVTVAIGALVPAHVVGAGASRCGHVLLADVGVAPVAAARTIAPPVVAALAPDAHKFTRGTVAVVGGAMPGASMLAATAAMHGGAGYVLLAEAHARSGAPHALVCRDAVDEASLTAILDDRRIGATVIGPGLGRGADAVARLRAALAASGDAVVDADALTLLADGERKTLRTDARQIYLTPHGGEFDRLFGPNGGNRIERTRAAARSTGAVVVHKGPDTVIASPNGRVVIAAGATAWLSTAGSGDVLAGLLAARHAANGKRDPLGIAAEAVWLHSAAGAAAGKAFVADDLVRHLPGALEAAGAR